MKIIYINIISNKNITSFSIINEQYYIGKSLISNIIRKMVNVDEKYNKIEVKIKEEDIKEQKKEEKLFYFGLLLDYFIFFEETFLFIYNPSKKNDNEYKNIYDKYIAYYKGFSLLNKNNNYSYVYEYIYDNNESINNINESWIKYIKNEYKTHNFQILYDSLNEMDKFTKFEKKYCYDSEKFYRKKFFDTIFTLLSENIIAPSLQDNNDKLKTIDLEKNIRFVNALIKLILYEGNNKNNIFKIYKKFEGENEDKNRKKIFERIIEGIIILIEKSMEKTNFFRIGEDLMLEYLNSLIILLESFGEYKSNYLQEIMFSDIGGKIELKSSFFGRLVLIFFIVWVITKGP